MQPNMLNRTNNRGCNLDDQNPYPGLHEFREIDKHYFFGRETEINELFDRIQKNFLTVIFGKSGIGKTSLLQAGLIPKLRNNFYLPIYIQIPKNADNVKNLLDQVKADIENKIKAADKTAISFDDLTLWEYFHKVQILDGLVNPLLIFDQFEDIFKLGKEMPESINPLIAEIGDLVQNWVPLVVQEKYEDKSIPYSDEEPIYRVIFSLREDYLVYLMNLYRIMPSVVNGHFHYRISRMRGEDAIKAVLNPGKEIIKVKEVAVEIIKKMPDTKDDDYIPHEIQDGSWESKKIEPFLLSLFCYRVNAKRQEVKARELSLNLLKHITVEDITKNHYEETIAKFDPAINIAIQEQLLTPEGSRKLQDVNSLKKGYNIQEKDIETLVDKRILRKEIRNNIDYVELIHDVLAPIIKEKRDERVTEKKNQEVKEQIERRYYRIAIVIISIIAIALGIFGIYGYFQKIRTEYNYQLYLTSEAFKEVQKDNTRAIRIAEAAYEKGIPNPPAWTSQVLSFIGYSSFDRPFYISTLHHKGEIYSGVFSPDGRRILTASEDGTAKLWAVKGDFTKDLKHGARVFSAVFSPDGSKILTASWDKTAKMWDKEGRLLLDLRHRGIVSSALFSPDGSKILTACWDGTARVWDMKGEPLTELKGHKNVLFSAFFSNDGSRILTASWDKSARLWDINGNLIAEYRHDSALSSVVFSQGSSQVLTSCEDGSVKLWDLQGKLLFDFNEYNGPVTSAVFSPDGKSILTASGQGTARLLDLDGKLLLKLEHNGIVSANFSPDGSRILTGSEHGTAKLWSMNGNLIASFNGSKDAISGAVFSPDGSLVLTAYKDGTAKVWGLKNDILVNLDKHRAAVNMAVFSPEGRNTLTASDDATAKLWDLQGNVVANLNKHIEPVSCAAFSPDGKRILTASMDASVKLWDGQGNFLRNLTNQIDPLTSVVLSPDGRNFLTTSLGFTAKLWNLEGKFLNELVHNGPVLSAVFSPDGRQVLTASEDGTARLWNLQGKMLVDLDRHDGKVISARFSPDGNLIITASEDGTARLWNIKGELREELKHKGPVLCALFSPDGSKILTASEDKTARIWSLAGKLPVNLAKHDGPVTSAEFSQDGRRILTASRDGTVKLWDLQGRVLADLTGHTGMITSAVFSQDGSRILTASRDGTARMWLTPEAIYRWLKLTKITQLPKETRENLGILQEISNDD